MTPFDIYMLSIAAVLIGGVLIGKEYGPVWNIGGVFLGGAGVASAGIVFAAFGVT